jgi:adenylosuccinate synthase
MYCDVLIGVRYGDEAKGKVAAEFCKNGRYTHTLRFNGSHNAGHTINVDGKKVVTHIVPTGAIFGIPSVIGPGCVVHEQDFVNELNELMEIQPNIHSLVKVAKNVHIVTDAHRQEELSESKIGTTRKGVGPCYRDKYARVGVRAESSQVLAPYLVDINDWVESNSSAVVLAEGAQALGLDIDGEEYPYVTSSHCGVGSVINNGIPHTAIRDVYGVAKAYDTYVGSRSFQDKSDPTLDVLGDVGNEYGATTGRRRQCNYLNIDELRKNVIRAGVTDLFINKMDVLRKVGAWRLLLSDGRVIQAKDEDDFKMRISDRLPPGVSLTFSGSPERI